MSYQVLARKWRPRNFSSLVGQEHVVRALTHALTEQRLHHAYLFTGTRGVGKTTLARILAKSLNCEAGVSPAPCGQCSSCQEIDAGRFVDLLEVDAATNTKVDEMRALLENAFYAPTRGRFKVYVIDEVHMLSNSAFNAMLKTLEEPPEHVKFILATTDPQKIPVTILSRCLQFNLKQMPPGAISGHLSRVLEAEGIAFEPAALGLIARSASGSMRDALSLLDQAIAHGAGKVETQQVREMLGSVDLDHLFALLEALVDGRIDEMIGVANQMAIRSLSFAEALLELSALLVRLQLAQLAPGTLADDEPDAERLLALARHMPADFVQLAYQIVLQGKSDLPMAPDEYAGFVMTLMRLHAFRPAHGEFLARGVSAQPAPVVAKPPVRRVEAVSPSTVIAAPTPVAPPVGSSRSEVSAANWHQLADSLGLSGMARELAQHCECRELSAERCLLRLPPAHRHLLMKPAQDKLQSVLQERFGAAMAVRIEIAEVEHDTPAVAVAKARQERQDQAIESIEQDFFVQDAIEGLDASLIDSSIKPLH